MMIAVCFNMTHDNIQIKGFVIVYLLQIALLYCMWITDAIQIASLFLDCSPAKRNHNFFFYYGQHDTGHRGTVNYFYRAELHLSLHFEINSPPYAFVTRLGI